MHQQQTAVENIVGKEEIARNEQFLLFLQCFLLNQRVVSPYVNIYDIIFYLLLNWKSPKLACEVEDLENAGKVLYPVKDKNYHLATLIL